MNIKKIESGEWLLDWEAVKNKRIRKKFPTKREAANYYNSLVIQYEKEGKPKTNDKKIKLQQLIELYVKTERNNIKNMPKIESLLLDMSEIMENPRAQNLDSTDWSKYQRIMIEERASEISTVNAYLQRLKRVYNWAKESGLVKYDNPAIRFKRVREQEKAVRFMTIKEIKRLLNGFDKEIDCEKRTELMVRIGLSTGARWGEISSREMHNFVQGRMVIDNTKGKKVRMIPMEEGLYNEVLDFLEKGDKLRGCTKVFTRIMEEVNIDSGKNQNTHILRHTFASHFMMNKGNILVLQKILGHTNINDTMKYAKFHPEHLQEAVLYNPLAALND